MSQRSHLSSLLLIVMAGLVMATSIPAQEKRAGKSSAGIEKPVTGPPGKLVTSEMIEAALDMPCPNLQFSGEHPLSDLLVVFESHWSQFLRYDVPFFEDVAELNLEGIETLKDISVSDMKISAGTHTCRDALELMFEQTVDPELSFLPAAGHLLVSTLAKAESEDTLFSRVYDLSDFLDTRSDATAGRRQRPTTKAAPQSSHSETAPAGQTAPKKRKKGRKKRGQEGTPKGNHESEGPTVLRQFGGGGGLGGGGGGLGGVNHSPTRLPKLTGLDAVITVIREQTSPPAKWYTVDGECGKLSVCAQYVVIRQTYAVHREVEQILDQLRAAMKTGGPPEWPDPADSLQAPANSAQGGFGGGQQGGGGAGFFHVAD